MGLFFVKLKTSSNRENIKKIHTLLCEAFFLLSLSEPAEPTWLYLKRAGRVRKDVRMELEVGPGAGVWISVSGRDDAHGSRGVTCFSCLNLGTFFLSRAEMRVWAVVCAEGTPSCPVTQAFSGLVKDAYLRPDTMFDISSAVYSKVWTRLWDRTYFTSLRGYILTFWLAFSFFLHLFLGVEHKHIHYLRKKRTQKATYALFQPSSAHRHKFCVSVNNRCAAERRGRGHLIKCAHCVLAWPTSVISVTCCLGWLDFRRCPEVYELLQSANWIRRWIWRTRNSHRGFKLHWGWKQLEPEVQPTELPAVMLMLFTSLLIKLTSPLAVVFASRLHPDSC